MSFDTQNPFGTPTRIPLHILATTRSNCRMFGRPTMVGTVNVGQGWDRFSSRMCLSLLYTTALAIILHNASPIVVRIRRSMASHLNAKVGLVRCRAPSRPSVPTDVV